MDEPVRPGDAERCGRQAAGEARLGRMQAAIEILFLLRRALEEAVQRRRGQRRGRRWRGRLRAGVSLKTSVISGMAKIPSGEEVLAAIDGDDGAGDHPRRIADQEGGEAADIVDVDEVMFGGVGGGGQHVVEMFQAAGGAGADRPRRDA